MCMCVYIGSMNKLPIVEWNDATPGFSLAEISGKNLPEVAAVSMKSNYYYEAYSFMGCACGFSYGEWSRKDKDEEHHLRVRDVEEFMRYLSDNFNDNSLKLFCTSWDIFPEEYEEKDFRIIAIDENEFDFEENVILKIEK